MPHAYMLHVPHQVHDVGTMCTQSSCAAWDVVWWGEGGKHRHRLHENLTSVASNMTIFPADEKGVRVIFFQKKTRQ